MQEVEFVRPWRFYSVGESDKFPEWLARMLVEHGFARVPELVKATKPKRGKRK
jgi:hypothetical protein